MGRDAEQVDLFDHGRVPRARRSQPRDDRHEVFASAVVKHLGNRTKAAKEAGYSARTAYSQGSRLMRHPGVCRMVAAKAQKAVENLDCSAERILKELTRIAFFDGRTIYAKDGTLKPLHKLSDEAAAVIAAVETSEITETVEIEGDEGAGKSRTRTVVRKVKLADKVRCLELLGRHRKLFTDMTESTVKVTLEDLVAGGSAKDE